MEVNSKEKNSKIIIGVIIGILILVIIFILLAFIPKYHTVTFDSNGGTLIEAIKVKENDKVKKPENPTKDGYIFAGWYLEDKLFDFDTKITKDITLKAHWDSDGIKINLTNISLVVGEGKKIEISSLPDGLNISDLIYTSSDESIVTVDELGNLKALKAGTVTITVKSRDGKYTTNCSVTVTASEVEVESIAINGASAVTVGNSIKLTVTIKPDNAEAQKLTWKSSDTSIATVDENGNVKGLKAGTVTITVTTPNGKTATKKITVNEKSSGSSTPTKPTEVVPTSVTISGNTEVNVGDSIQLSATVNPSNAKNKSVTWSSANPSIATVDGSGKVVGVSSGTVIITVTTSNGKTATIEITVKDTYVIYLTKRELAVVGGAIQYDFKVLRNGKEFNDYLGFVYNGTPIEKNQGSVSSTTVETGGNTAKLKLTNKQEVTATVIKN